MSDSEDLLQSVKSRKRSKNHELRNDPDESDTLGNMFAAAFKAIPLKLAFLLFIFILVYNSTIFIDSVFTKIMPSGVTGGAYNEKGTVAMAVLVSITYILLSFLSTCKMI